MKAVLAAFGLIFIMLPIVHCRCFCAMFIYRHLLKWISLPIFTSSVYSGSLLIFILDLFFILQGGRKANDDLIKVLINSVLLGLIKYEISVQRPFKSIFDDWSYLSFVFVYYWSIY